MYLYYSPVSVLGTIGINLKPKEERHLHFLSADFCGGNLTFKLTLNSTGRGTDLKTESGCW